MSDIEIGSVWVGKKTVSVLVISDVSDSRVETYWLGDPDSKFEWLKDDFLSKYKPEHPQYPRYRRSDFQASPNKHPSDDQILKDKKPFTANGKPMCLIGIAGKARGGKDTLASYLLDNLDGTWSRSSFADPIKEMLRAIGVDCSDDKKSEISNDYGVTARYMMQTLGTEWGRELIGSHIWVNAFARLNAGKSIVVPDVRFENEAELVRAHGVLIHLVGRGGIEGDHVSENTLAFQNGDIVIDNSRDIEWMFAQIDSNARLAQIATDQE